MLRTIALRPRGRSSAAFTLMEIILVVVIIGIMLTLVVPRITGRAKKARAVTAKHQIEAFATSLQNYEIDVGDFPKSLQALVEKPPEVDEKMWDGPYMKSIPKDPWNHEYHYRAPGEHFKDYDLWSDGPDGQSGTDDDITSWVTEAK